MSPSGSQVLAYLGGERYRPSKLKDLARSLGVGSDDYAQFRRLMHDLEHRGEVTRVHRGRFVLRSALRSTWGRVRVHPKGFAFVVRAGAEADVFVPAGSLLDAADGDWVEVEITQAGDGGDELPRGRVVAVRSAPRRQLVGTYRHRGRHGLVVVDEALVSLDAAPAEPARDGDLVVIELDADTPQLPGRALRGRVLRTLGDPEDPRHDFDTVVLAHGIPCGDGAEAEAAVAARIPGAAADRRAQLSLRRDLRSLTVVTIDPDTARDFDDAVSLEPLDSGCQRLGVHIADVAHYVPAGGPVDRQARERGTSVYLLDRVVHMLPRGLAGDLCTLAPGEDRLALSVLLDVDGAGRIQKRAFCLSVIHSAARLTYRQVQAALEGGGHGAGPAAAHAVLLGEMADLSQRLRARRLGRGAIDFDLPEAEVEMGPGGVPTALGKAPRLRSHRLVEEFMLAANEAVAAEVAEADLDVLYRIHDPPDPEKLDRFRELAAALGHRLPPAEALTSGDLQTALEQLANRPDTALLGQLLLRAMMRARYAVDPGAGHFGLASQCYLHFTSPIRRYPDLVVHRALRAHLSGGEQPAATDADGGLEWLAEWTSHCERRGEAAERDYTRLKQLRFMSGRVGEEFDGVVSGVVGAGAFVELGEWMVEGFCPVRLLADDFYEFDEVRHRLRGRRTGVVLALGTPVRVRVLSVELPLRRMDLLLVGCSAPFEGRGAPKQSRSGPRPKVSGRSGRRADASQVRRARRSGRRKG